MNMPNRERRDWGLIIFIIPIGIFLIVIVGQLAIGLFPNWRINADMNSNLDPNSAPGQPASLLQPLLPQILTPMAWAQTYLTPGADISFPPFFVIEPTSSASPSPTVVSPTPTTATPTASATPSPTSSVTATSTPNPTDDDTPTPTATTPSPSPTTPSPSPTTPSPSPTTPSPTPTGTPVTPDPSFTQISPTPPGIDLDAPDGTPASLPNGGYIVINIGGNPIVVSLTPDSFYDLVFYESAFNPTLIQLDQIIIGISNDNGLTYYEVFNWGNGIPDTNTNVDTNILTPDPSCILEPECDNREIPQADLHPTPGTGILIDVDNAPGAPPPGTYDYLVIISPNTGSGDDSQIDAVVVTEVPLPTPTPTP